MHRRPPHVCLACRRALSTKAAIDAAALFGPREIYDAARTRDKVISIDYDRVLKLAESTADVDPRDLFVVSKILRRVPRSVDAEEKVVKRERSALARRLTKAAADQGDSAAALFWSEETLRSKSSTQEQRQEAMRLLTNLGMQGDGKANLLIGNELYSLGKKSEALRAYRLAGEQGNGEAYTKLGRILRFDGHHKQSVQAFELAAELDEPDAHFMLSTFAAADQAAAAKKSDQAAIAAAKAKQVHHLLKAAAGGVIEAQHNLGDLYRRDDNAALAKEYLEAAAKRGFQPSQANLAALQLKLGQYEDARAWALEAQRAGGDIGTHAAELLKEIDAAQAQKSDKTSCVVM